ncbi:hypothetical protein DK926_18905 [Rhodococcus sp. Eu-32]|uniref:hypothetical protein n=1 Tax=Rhodococcus sp. Eu-32 TaxID=1017319 RepID=UPI000F782262|nr:hypothetical protein [Rhodococcus sp. Eu-32]RRQ26315.1 hypothetical protein DK926_18905 [Rhodococcus sp. Eu-32]
MTANRTVRPRPGSHIWRRIDGQFTVVGHKESGLGYVDKFPGASDVDRLAAQMQQPGGYTIGQGVDQIEVEDILNWDDLTHPDKDVAAVILGPNKPPFGEWEELSEWPETV